MLWWMELQTPLDSNAMSVVLNLRHLKGKIDNVARMYSKQGMRKIGLKVVELNNTQIIKQQDNKGNKFKKYNAKYAEKKKKGKRLPIDFSLTGIMLKAFGITGLRNGIVILGFHGVTEKLKAAGNYKLRKFIGLHKQNKRNLFAWILRKFIRK